MPPLRCLSYILGGWAFGSIINMQSGGPFAAHMLSNTTNAFSGGLLRANLAGDPDLPTGERTVKRWFNTDAFEAPAAYTFGNAGRGIIRADGRINFDFFINKSIRFGENKSLQLRGDLFNAFNHADFSLPGRSLGGADFGAIGDATNPRTIQFGLRINF